MISTCITVMAGRLPDAPFALELVQLESVGVCMQLSGDNRHHHHDQYKDLRYHRLSLRVCIRSACSFLGVIVIIIMINIRIFVIIDGLCESAYTQLSGGKDIMVSSSCTMHTIKKLV